MKLLSIIEVFYTMSNKKINICINGINFIDGPVVDIYNLINNSSYNVVTFDFFDTLVFRRVLNPQQIFHIIGYQLIKKKLIKSYISAGQFASLRVLCEKTARKHEYDKNKIDEVNLYQIYSLIDEHLYTTSKATFIKQSINTEIEIEKKFLVRDSILYELLMLSKKVGKKVGIISDTYFSSNELLSLVDFDFDFDFVATSCDFKTGKCKNLFPEISEKFNINLSKMIHIGDNYQADYKIPLTYGVKPIHIPNSTIEFNSIVLSERKPKVFFKEIEKKWHYDQMYTSVRSRHAHFHKYKNFSFFDYGYAIFGIIYSSYAKWVSDEINRYKYNYVLGVMREGNFLTKILKKFGIKESKLLFCNRSIILAASIYNLDLESLNELFLSRKILTFKQMFHKIWINSVNNFQYSLDSYCDTEDKKNYFFNFILKESTYKKIIENKCKYIRKNLLNHFFSLINVNDNSKELSIALIDIGWNGTIQKKLQYILNKEGYLIHLYGFYLMTTPNSINLYSKGISFSGFITDGANYTNFEENLLRVLEILEQSSTSPIGTTLGYTNYGDPVYQENKVINQQQLDISEIQNGILTFTDFIIDNKLTKGLPSKDSYLLKCILHRAMINPLDFEIQLFKEWIHDDNLEYNNQENIISKLFNEISPYLTLDILKKNTMVDVYWPFASLAIANTSLLRLYNAYSLEIIEKTDIERSYEKEFICEFMTTKGSYTSQFQIYKNLNEKGILQLNIDNSVYKIIINSPSRNIIVDSIYVKSTTSNIFLSLIYNQDYIFEDYKIILSFENIKKYFYKKDVFICISFDKYDSYNLENELSSFFCSHNIKKIDGNLDTFFGRHIMNQNIDVFIPQMTEGNVTGWIGNKNQDKLFEKIFLKIESNNDVLYFKGNMTQRKDVNSFLKSSEKIFHGVSSVLNIENIQEGKNKIFICGVIEKNLYVYESQNIISIKKGNKISEI